MGNSLRCCLACMLPFGALDVVRVVHLNGHVEEYSRQISAAEVLAANPNHILSKPCSQSDHVVHRIMIVSSESELKRGNIYFLIPSASVPERKKKKEKKSAAETKTKDTDMTIKMPDQDGYLKKILSEKKSSHHRRRSGRVGVWRPQLESISEDQ